MREKEGGYEGSVGSLVLPLTCARIAKEDDWRTFIVLFVGYVFARGKKGTVYEGVSRLIPPFAIDRVDKQCHEVLYVPTGSVLSPLLQ